MSKRNGRYYAAFGVVTLLLLGVVPATAQDQPKAAADESEAAAKPKADSDQRAPDLSVESLAIDREANRIAERANLIAETQRSYAFWQTVLGAFGVLFTAVAAIAAIAAAIYAKRAAKAAGESAVADNEALGITIQAAADAREDAAVQAERFGKQMAKTQEMVEFTAKSSYAMERSAQATRRMATAMGASVTAAQKSLELSTETAAMQLRPYVYVADEVIKISAVGIGVGGKFSRFVNDTGEITFAIKNFGLTPAKRVRLKARAFVGEYWLDGGDVDLEAATEIHRADLPPGFDRRIHGYTVPGLAETYGKILNGQQSIFFDGLIEYEDAGGRKYVTHFRRVATGHDVQDGIFIITAEGNEAT